MHLLFYSPRFYPLVGGLEKVVSAWGEALTRKGHTIQLITDTPFSESDHYPFEVYRNLPALKIRRLIRQADLLVQFNISLKGLLPWVGTRTPLVVTHHTLLTEGSVPVGWQQHLKKWFCNRFVARNICCSAYVARQFEGAAVVHSPYDASVFRYLHSPRRPGSIVFVGRLVSDKGVDLLLEAMQSLAQGDYDSLTIVGEGPERSELETMAKRGSLKVVFTGKLSSPELAELLHSKDIMVVPSRVEPFGITVLEGLACGCKMVVSDAGGLPEAAGGLARLFKNGDGQALALALTQALQEQARQHEAAVARHLQKMTVACTSAQFEATLMKVLE